MNGRAHPTRSQRSEDRGAEVAPLRIVDPARQALVARMERLPEAIPDHIGPLSMAEVLARPFLCLPRLEMVPVGRCLDDYCTHTALRAEGSPCNGCAQGAWNRKRFAAS